MHELELLVDEIDGRLHAAIARKTQLINLYTDALENPAPWASLYLGRVDKIDTRLDAAIVDLGNGLSGFLPAKHVHFSGADPSEKRTGLSQMLKPGQMILTQVKSEAKRSSTHEQQKLPRLTMKICVMGQHLLYSPVASRVTISRKIDNEEILALTAKLKGAGGWIVQQSAGEAQEEDIISESNLLLEDWQAIEDAKEIGGGKPRLLKRGPNAFTRALLDYGSDAFSHIYVANKKLLDTAQAWCRRHAPALAESKRLRLFRPEKPGQKLYDLYDVYSELVTLEDTFVPLAGGGSIIIEPTHAVIMIDVNQGSMTSAAEANQEAAAEAVRQVRLRNLSGAILVDFINMHHKSERFHLIEKLEDMVKDDFAITQVHGFTRLGIVEITRKRRTATLAEKRKVHLTK